jgi:hypothetical protein
MKIISTYEAGSGQKVNLQKTSAFFSRNTSLDRRQEILQLSGFSESHGIEAYLGLPTFVGRSRNQAFHFIKEKVWNKLNNWKINFLSQAGKEILLKAVIQAIPTYCMCIFQLPISLCKNINGMMQIFLWNHMSKTSKIPWMSWDRLSRSKSMGGLGFRDLVVFNQALLAKQGWRLIQIPNSLTARIFKNKYYPSTTFLEASQRPQISFVWRSLLNARNLLKQGLLWRVGDGLFIKVWKDHWLPTPTTHSVQSPQVRLGEEATVSELIDMERGCWNTSIIYEIFSEEEEKVIVNIPLSLRLPPDRLI